MWFLKSCLIEEIFKRNVCLPVVCWNRNNFVRFSLSALHSIFVCKKWICHYFSSVVSFEFFFSEFIPPHQFSCVVYFQFLILLIVFQEAQKVLRRLCPSLWAVLNTWSSSRVLRWDEEKSNTYFRVLRCYTKCSFPILQCMLHFKAKWGSCRSCEGDAAMHQGACPAASRDRQPQPHWESHGWWWKRCWGSLVRVSHLGQMCFLWKEATLSELILKTREVLMPKCLKKK